MMEKVTMSNRFRAKITSISTGLAKPIVIIAIFLLAACQATAPARPTTLHQRQVATLRALGFAEKDGEWLMSIAEPISFDLDKAELHPSLDPLIKRMAGELLGADISVLRIEGHTDNTGARAYNEQLSLRRSEAVAAAFARYGFMRSHIACRGLAWDFPVATNATRKGRAENRRVDVIVPADSMAPAP